MADFTLDIFNQFIDSFSVLDEQAILSENKDGADTVYVSLHVSNLRYMWQSDAKCGIADVKSLMEEWFISMECLTKEGKATKKISGITFIDASLVFEKNDEYLYSSHFAKADTSGVKVDEDYISPNAKETVIKMLLDEEEGE